MRYQRRFQDIAITAGVVNLLAVCGGCSSPMPPTVVEREGIQISHITDEYGPQGYRVSFEIMNNSLVAKRVRLKAGLVSRSSLGRHPEKRLVAEASLELEPSQQRESSVVLGLPPKGYRGVGRWRRRAPFRDPYVEIVSVTDLLEKKGVN